MVSNPAPHSVTEDAMKVESMDNLDGLYLYEAMEVPYKTALDVPCIYGGHCDACPHHQPWDMTIETDRYENGQIVLTQGRESYGEPLGRRVVSVLLSHKDENGDWRTIKNGIKTFLLPDCLEGYKWLLDFIYEVYLSATVDADAIYFKTGKRLTITADWDFKTYFPDWDRFSMSDYFLKWGK